MASQLTWAAMSETWAIVWSVSLFAAGASAAVQRRRLGSAATSSLLVGIFLAYFLLLGAMFSTFGVLQHMKSNGQISPELCYFMMLMAGVLPGAPVILDHCGRLALKRREQGRAAGSCGR
jgi:hypothetical protein